MKLRAVLAAIIGLGLFAFILFHVGLAAVAGTAEAIGWRGFGLLVVCQAAVIALTGLGWSLLAIGRAQQGAAPFVIARFVRDAACQILPFTSVGGIALGARALALEGVSPRAALRTTLIDVTLEFASLIVYVALGLFILEAQHPADFFSRPVLAIALGLPAMAGALALASRYGLPFGRGVSAVAGRFFGRAPADLEAPSPPPKWPFALAALVHLVGWSLAGVLTWLILHLLRMHTALEGAILIDSLTSGLKAVAFAIPSGIGVQEGGFVLLGGLLGVSPSVAIALSLIRRGRDIVIAVPVIALWQLRHRSRIWMLAPRSSASDR